MRLDPNAFLTDLPQDGPVLLVCVDREPQACHRGLVAARLSTAGATVTHLKP